MFGADACCSVVQCDDIGSVVPGDGGASTEHRKGCDCDGDEF